MTNDLTNSNNKLIKDIGREIFGSNNILQNNQLSINEQKAQLRTLFTQITDNNATATDKKALQNGADILQNKIEKLEKEMENLQGKIKEKQDLVDLKVNYITDLITQSKDQSSKMESDQHKVVKRCVEDVLNLYKSGNSGITQYTISQNIKDRIKGNSTLNKDKKEMDKILADLDDCKLQVDNLVHECTPLIDSISNYERQYGVTKSAHNLITRTISQIGNTDTNYKNSDYDTKLPVYSIEKTAIVSNLFDDESLNVLSTNKDFGGETKTVLTKDQITEKYSQYFAPNKNGVTGDSYSSANNPAFKKLNDAIEAGLFEDLRNSDMTAAQINEFFGTNYAGANIMYDKTSKQLAIPYGHDTLSKSVCNNLADFIKNTNKNKYIKNTWDKNQGNTISSNEQIKALGDNYEMIIDTLANGEPPFTFKEAMYALFDSNNGLFKNSGITFDLSKQGQNPNYTIDAAGDEATNTLYKNIAKEIFDAWGVNATFNGTAKDPTMLSGGHPEDDDTPETPVMVDPVTFRFGDTEYAFIMDKNEDGKFSGMNEFMGGQKGTSWLEDLSTYDYNKDGKINEEDVKDGVSALSQIKLLSSKYTDNASETIKDGHLHETDNKIDYSIVTAESAGITKIDLSEYFDNETRTYQFDKVDDRAKDVHGGNKTDINGSAVFNDGFKVTMNNEEIDASRKDDRNDKENNFMETVYGKAIGKGFNLGLTKEQADQEIENGYSRFDELAKDGKKLANGVTMLANFDSLNNEVHMEYNNTLERIASDEIAEITRANNIARAETTLDGWDKMFTDIQAEANSRGITIEEAQAKGIYNINKGITAQGVVNKYIEQIENEANIEKSRKNSALVWDSLIACFKDGLNVTAGQINKVVSEGKATTVNEVVKYFKGQQSE